MNRPQMVVVQTLPANGMAVAALVLGIIGAVIGLIPILAVPALICGVLALIFGPVAWKRARNGAPRKAMAIWGTSMGALAVTLSIIGFVIVDNAFNSL